MEEGVLFETRKEKRREAYKVFAGTVLVGICLIWIYRLANCPAATEGPGRRWAWLGMFASELALGIYWIFTQSARWNVVDHRPFKDILSLRYQEKLPRVDVFVCTADPKIEPPTMVINTVLSAMSFNYPSDKVSVYLSDDGCSEFTFYALLEASQFSRHWIPFCNRFRIEPRSPAVYLASAHHPMFDPRYVEFARDLSAIKELYEDMRIRIETALEKNSIPAAIKDQHKGFSEWENSKVTKQNHPSIVQIIIDGRNPDSVDTDGHRLPTVVYLAREKRRQWHHNFKAGSMNALIRVSSVISNAPILLNLDCDMYSNDSDAIREALCFFMDEKQGHEISFIQHPQCFNNITKNDIYCSAVNVIHKIELRGIGGYGAALYCGTGCFHRRASLCGRKFSMDCVEPEWNSGINDEIKYKTVTELEEAARVMANCDYEKGTQWGKQMGLVYGCPVEDIITGLTIQCRGWKSIYHFPERKAFVGIAPLTIEQSLVQHKRWSEGMFQIFLSKYCPFIYGRNKIRLVSQMGYCIYLLWATISVPILYFVIVPSICLLRGIPLFPQMSSIWFLPFAYVFISRIACSLVESLVTGNTVKGWWNEQRMWLIRRTTAYFFALIDTIIRRLGFSQEAFSITAKVAEDDVLTRYEQEIIEFGSTSIMFVIMSTLALLNLFSLTIWVIKRSVWRMDPEAVESLIPNAILCGMVVLINLPVYQALFFRSDKGSLPLPVLFKSVAIASIACLLCVF